jgi:hypothetical protein
MMQYEEADRIPTYAMLKNLEVITRSLAHVNEITSNGGFPLVQTDPRADWIDKGIMNPLSPSLGTDIKIRNLKRSTQMDQTFYAGHLMLDY